MTSTVRRQSLLFTPSVRKSFPISCPLCFLDYLFYFKDFLLLLFYVLQSILVINRLDLQLSRIWLREPFQTGPQQSQFFFTSWRSEMSQAWGGALAGCTQPHGPQKQPLASGVGGPEGGPQAAREAAGLVGIRGSLSQKHPQPSFNSWPGFQETGHQPAWASHFTSHPFAFGSRKDVSYGAKMKKNCSFQLH